MNKLTASDVEIRVARLFNYRANLIVPNVSWGLHLGHECDMLIVTPARYATEVEIKVTAADIRADNKKRHQHRSNKIRRLYFAVPDYLASCPDLPPDAGLISVDSHGDPWHTKIVRRPRFNKLARRLSEDEYAKLAELGCMRIWSLKEHIALLKQERKKDERQKSECIVG
jgi:hypothetical protein